MRGTSEPGTSPVSLYNEPSVGTSEINKHLLSFSEKVQGVSSLLWCQLENVSFKIKVAVFKYHIVFRISLVFRFLSNSSYLTIFNTNCKQYFPA